MIQDGLVTLLKSDPTIQALCSGRIWPVVVPKNALLPAITFLDVSRTSQNLLQGEGLTTKRIQFDCWGKTYTDVKHLQAAVMAVINNFSGVLPDGTQVQTTVADTAIDFYESDGYLYRTTNDFIFVGNNL